MEVCDCKKIYSYLHDRHVTRTMKRDSQSYAHKSTATPECVDRYYSRGPLPGWFKLHHRRHASEPRCHFPFKAACGCTCGLQLRLGASEGNSPSASSLGLDMFGCSARRERVSAFEASFGGSDAVRTRFRPGQPTCTDGNMSGGPAAGEDSAEYGSRIARVGKPVDGGRLGGLFGVTRPLRSEPPGSALRVAAVALGVKFACTTVVHEEARGRGVEPSSLARDTAGVRIVGRLEAD